MQKEYLKIWETAHKEIYNFIKNSNLSIKEYNFTKYFDYITSQKDIIVLEHHFKDINILGTTKIDYLGRTISYEKNSLPQRQNFTKCHEIGHIILKHKGGTFTEQIDNKSPIEIQADFFASIMLAPDIVLMKKVIEENKNFYSIANELKISNQALELRLSHLVQFYNKIKYTDGNNIAKSFRNSDYDSYKLKKIISQYKEEIINNFKNTMVDPQKKLDYMLHNQELFISNFDIDILNKEDIRKDITTEFPNYEFWACYNKGKSIWFCWNNLILTKSEACKIAQDTLLKNIY